VRSASVVRMWAIVMRRSAPIHSLRYGSPILGPTQISWPIWVSGLARTGAIR